MLAKKQNIELFRYIDRKLLNENVFKTSMYIVQHYAILIEVKCLEDSQLFEWLNCDRQVSQSLLI